MGSKGPVGGLKEASPPARTEASAGLRKLLETRREERAMPEKPNKGGGWG